MDFSLPTNFGSLFTQALAGNEEGRDEDWDGSGAFRMTFPFSRREILGCSGGVAVGLIAGANFPNGKVALKRRKVEDGHEAASESIAIRLFFNENPYGPPDSAKRAMRAMIDGTWRYGHEDVRLLRSVIAEQEGLRPDNVIITEGSGELLKIAGLVFGAGKDVVSAMPTFTILADYAIRNGGRIEWVDLDSDMRVDLSAMEDRVADHTGVIYVCNPNNPTGTIVNPDDLRGFIRAVSQRATVLVDEAYIDLTDEPQKNSMVNQIKAGLNVVVSRTFPKCMVWRA